MSAVLEPIVGRCLALARIREGHPASVLAHPRLRRSPISRRAERCRDHRALPRDRLRHAVARKVLAAPRLRARGVSPDARLLHVVSRGDIAGLVARLAAASCSTLPPRTPSASARISGCRPRRTSRPTKTPSGCIMPTCAVAKCAPASCRDSSSPPRSRHAVRDHAGSRIPERFLGHLRPVLNEVAAS